MNLAIQKHLQTNAIVYMFNVIDIFVKLQFM